MSNGLPLGVVIPTKNSAAQLPRHLAALRDWLGLAEQVIVVDSFSTDGTMELLRRELRHPNLEFLSYPPGLYRSWNHAIQRLTTEYTYLATVGDTITREGVQHLAAAARSLDCDVVVSKPRFQDLQGRFVDGEWPIDDLIATLDIRAPQRLHPLEALVFASVHPEGALTGSCASDLFRTDCLKRFPFPTEFGTTGDGAWSIMHAMEVGWGVVPGLFSVFLKHPGSPTVEEKASHREAPRMDQVLRAATARWLAEGTVQPQDLARLHWDALLRCLTDYLDDKAVFDTQRQGRLPWILHPTAWYHRYRRQRHAARLDLLKQQALAAVRSDAVPTAQPP